MNINRLSLLINKLPTILVIPLLTGGLFSCPAMAQEAVFPPSDSMTVYEPPSVPLSKKELNPDSLLHFARLHLGTPYKLSGKNAKGFDCSGFVHYVYKQFDIIVPYSCPAISSYCTQRINKKELQKGDLLFFKGSNINSKAIGHVAIVYSVNESEIKMIHSCRRGVILENLNESAYYKSRYLFAKRVL